MNCSTPFRTAPVLAPNLINWSLLRRGFTVVLLVLAFTFALSPIMRAVDPPPDGGYPGDNTAEGENALFSLTTGTDNTGFGFDALFSNAVGSGNTATGSKALQNNNALDQSSVYGNYNTADGASALYSNTTGYRNTANGFEALYTNTTGGDNTASGYGALANNSSAGGNTATGSGALGGNTPQGANTATGFDALYYNTAYGNTATGFEALFSNTMGGGNTAHGYRALFYNTTGADNTASGDIALQNNTMGSGNVANGEGALQRNATGSSNVANGNYALQNNMTGNNNTAEGFNALYNSTGSGNIAVGFKAGVNLTGGSNNIDIGTAGVAGESAKIRIGKQGTQNGTFVAGIRGTTVAGGVAVIIDTNGHLGTVSSSGRFKQGIKPMDKVSEGILALKPVTFCYKKELDPDGIPQFGLVAEEVEKVNPDLVARDAEGKVYTVRYEAVNAMLLNEFLKEHQRAVEEHRKVEEQGASIAQLKKQIEALTATVRKVSDQVALSKPEPQLVANP